MKRVCAWCNTEQGSTGSDRQITHILCDNCLDNIIFQLGGNLRQYLDSLPTPVIVVNEDSVVEMANTSACAMLGKTCDVIEQQLGGVVFECAYSRLPDGCGKTVHCSGCTIRRAVRETFTTGVSRVRVPAYLSRRLVGPNEIALFITTEKVGNYVLLRVDDMDNTTTLPPLSVLVQRELDNPSDAG